MNLILLPQESNELRKVYERAITKANELYFFTAYLTEWEFKKKLTSQCRKIEIYFGKDFGISKKSAIKNALKWLPRKHKCNLFVIDRISGFHPKLLTWRENNKYFLLLGSSNLTQAGFATNIEANSFQEISKKEFNKILEWMTYIRQFIRVVDDEWINNIYKESPVRISANTQTTRAIAYLKPLPNLTKKEISERRIQLEAFSSIKIPLSKLIENCANGKVSNMAFWKIMFYKLWGRSKARIQGLGFERSGKHANWREVCKSLFHIFSTNDISRDVVVREEIDRLANKHVPVREAWLSEILGHYYPKDYPLLNAPSRNWLSASEYRKPMGSSEGAEYIDIARKFRAYLRESKQYRNLMELDRAVWDKYPKQ